MAPILQMFSVPCHLIAKERYFSYHFKENIVSFLDLRLRTLILFFELHLSENLHK